jgi:hypothetical protein
MMMSPGVETCSNMKAAMATSLVSFFLQLEVCRRGDYDIILLLRKSIGSNLE